MNIPAPVLPFVAEDFMQALKTLQLKLISAYASYPGICNSIVPNNQESIEQLVDHLTSLGHTRFAWLGGNVRLKGSRARFDALKDGLAARNIELDECCTVNAERAGRQDGLDCAEQLMRQTEGRNLPTAWICHNGLIARGALQFAYINGIKVPDEISIAAVDRTRVCTEIHPELTSAASDPELIGKEIARLLLEKEVHDGSLPPMLTDRTAPSVFNEGETSGPCPA